MVEATPSSDPQGTGIAAALPFLHPARISAALDPRLTAETVRKLQACQRLRERLAERMRAPLAAEDLWPIMGLEELDTVADQPREIALLAGAVWHAASLRLVVTGKAAAELVAAIGERTFTFGLRHATEAVAVAREAEPLVLADAIEQDGLACLGAWLANGPKPRRQAFLLRLSPDDAEVTSRFDSGHQAACARVMALALAEEGTR